MAVVGTGLKRVAGERRRRDPAGRADDRATLVARFAEAPAAQPRPTA